MLKEKREKKFVEFLDQFKPQIYRICWGFVDDDLSVDDLFQESMLRVWNAIDKHSGEAKLSTWAYRITVNTCIYWKKKTKRAKLNLDISEYADLEATTTIENDERNRSNILKLRSAIQKLNGVDRSIILLVLEECSYKEISEITGMTTSNVGVKINRIKARLKTIINNK